MPSSRACLDNIGVCRLDFRQGCFEILILGEECFLHDDLAAGGLKLLLEDLAEALRVIRAGIEVQDSGLGLQFLDGEVCHDIALLRVDEAAAEDIRLNLAVLDRDIRVRSARSDDRNFVVRGDLGLCHDVCRDGRSDENLDAVIRDQLRRRIDGLRGLRLRVALRQDDLLAVDTTGIVALLDGEFEAIARSRAVVSLITGQLKVCADFDLVRVVAAAAAGKDTANHECTNDGTHEFQAFFTEFHKILLPVQSPVPSLQFDDVPIIVYKFTLVNRLLLFLFHRMRILVFIKGITRTHIAMYSVS